jgi:hypothetical protein
MQVFVTIEHLNFKNFFLIFLMSRFHGSEVVVQTSPVSSSRYR